MAGVYHTPQRQTLCCASAVCGGTTWSACFEHSVREVAHLDGFGQLLPDDKDSITDILTSWVTMSPLQEAEEEVGEETEIEKLDGDPQFPSALTGEALDFLTEASEADSGPMPFFEGGMSRAS